MNFKLIFFLFLISSCGVKAPPKSNKVVPSIFESYTKEMKKKLKESDPQEKKKAK